MSADQKTNLRKLRKNFRLIRDLRTEGGRHEPIKHPAAGTCPTVIVGDKSLDRAPDE